MGNDLLTVLTGFHREVVLPDWSALSEHESLFSAVMLSNFASIDENLDRPVVECQSLHMAGLEQRIAAVEASLEMTSTPSL